MGKFWISLWCFLVMLIMAQNVSASENYSEQRRALVEEIENDVRSTAKYINKKSLDERVLKAIETVPRHKFVPSESREYAYENRPLSIGYGQTISQPYIVALMTDLLAPKPGQKVLEIGTGSGYQAAILAQLVDHVFTIEIIEELGHTATGLLAELGYKNVMTRVADGYDGWPEHGPFDGIVVTAAISHIPPPLVQQLARGGRMVIPVGTRFQTQYLTLIEKDMEGEVSSRQILPVIFVPFTGGH